MKKLLDFLRNNGVFVQIILFLIPPISSNFSRILTIDDAVERAAATTTKKGLTVYVDINFKTYEIQRPIDESYERNLKQRVVFQESLPKWNYLVKRP